jgi:hypothetical protein
MQFAREERSKRKNNEQSLTLFQDQEYDEYWHSKWNQVRRLQEGQEKKMTRNQTMRRKQQKMISRILNWQIWQIWNHLNMQVCLLTKRSTISYEEAWFTIQIVMIHLLMICIDL